MSRLDAINTIIIDLDDTVWNWLESWYSVYAPGMEALADELDCSFEQACARVREAHRTAQSPEPLGLAYLLDSKLPSVDQLRRSMWSAQLAALRTFEGVVSTLTQLKRKSYRIVACTESQYDLVRIRLFHTGLDKYLDHLSTKCTYDPRSDQWSFPNRTNFTPILPRMSKPNTDILWNLLEDLDKDPDQCLYVGDSLKRDIRMANDVGMPSVWANIKRPLPQGYELIDKLTHWTDEELQSRHDHEGQPQFIIHKFKELLEVVK